MQVDFVLLPIHTATELLLFVPECVSYLAESIGVLSRQNAKTVLCGRPLQKSLHYTFLSMIRVNVSLYGSLARFGGGHYVAQISVELEPNSGKAELLDQLSIPKDERGYLFINSVLCEVPGVETGANEILDDGDHVGIFSIDRLWPYQYRDGVVMSEGLKAMLEEKGAMHHSYQQEDGLYKDNQTLF